MKGIEEAFVDSGLDYELFFEYMDTKRFHDSAMLEDLVSLYDGKYSDSFFDAVILCDNNALDFFLKYRNRIAPHVPIIFCGVNNFEPGMLQGHTGITGVVEKVDHISNLQLMKYLNANVRRIIAIADCTRTSQLMMNELEQAVKIAGIRYELEKWLCVSREELLKRLEQYSPQETVLFPLTFYTQPNGDVLTAQEYYETFKSLKFQTYTGYRVYVDNGFFGGVVIDGLLHGRAAAKMAIKVLKGSNVNDIPILDEPPVRVRLNYDRLEALGLSEVELPEGAIVVGQPVTFYAGNKVLVWAAVVAIVSLAGLSLFLFVVVLQRNKATRALRVSEERFDMALDAVADGLWDWDLRTNEVFFSPEYYKMLGYAPYEFPERVESWEALLHPDDLDAAINRVTDYLNLYAAYGEIHHYAGEFRMKMKDGRWKWVLGRGGVTEVAVDGSPVRMIGTHMDLSDTKPMEPADND